LPPANPTGARTHGLRGFRQAAVGAPDPVAQLAGMSDTLRSNETELSDMPAKSIL
jgi:hypothetical protein